MQRRLRRQQAHWKSKIGESGQLIVLLQQGCDLRDADSTGVMEPYVAVRFNQAGDSGVDLANETNSDADITWKGQPIAGGGKNPKFDQHALFETKLAYLKQEGAELNFTIHDKNRSKFKKNLVGEGSFELKELFSTKNLNMEIQIPLYNG